jgi:tRNA(Arg) A34 adenosine deaminase TadA
MEHAIQLAIENVQSGRGGPFGAVIVRDGAILAEGVNLVTSTCDPTAHAEVTAIRRACASLGVFHLDGATIYASCEPCPMCLAAIYWAHIGRIYFGCTHRDAAEIGFDDSKIYQEMRRSLQDREIPMEQLARESALEAFEAWRRKADRREY